MRKVLLVITLLWVALQSSQSISAQENIGPWIKDYDAEGSPYVWTSIYDNEEFWSMQIAYSDYWGMKFALHINGEYLQIWQPSLTFGTNYVVKPDEFNGKIMYLHAPGQINKIINMIDAGNCPIKVTFFLSGKQHTKTFRYRFHPGYFKSAIDTFLDERL